MYLVEYWESTGSIFESSMTGGVTLVAVSSVYLVHDQHISCVVM